MHIIKLYTWKMLLRLAIKDVQRRHKIKTLEEPFGYVAGLDTEGNPYIRIDLKPLKLPDGHSEHGE